MLLECVGYIARRITIVELQWIVKMTFFRYLIMLFFLIFASISQAKSGHDEQNFYRNFWNPTFNIQRLSYCSLDGKECGQSVANRYCHLMGYEVASDAIIDYNVGVTHYLLTHARCKGWRCNGFMLITCKNKFHHQPVKDYYYREQRFVFPRYAHYRVDWCYKNGAQCSGRAAYSFCRRMGYGQVKQFKKEAHVAATKALGNQRLCFGEACEGFSEIICGR